MNLIEKRVNFRGMDRQQIALFRGETVRARYTFSDGYAPIVFPSDAKALFLYRAHGNDTWWRSSAVIVGDGVEFDITPEMDNASTDYVWFVRIIRATQVYDIETDDTKDAEGVLYRVNGFLHYEHSPGETPNALPVPPKVLDFDTVETRNAPFVTAVSVGGALQPKDGGVVMLPAAGTRVFPSPESLETNFPASAENAGERAIVARIMSGSPVVDVYVAVEGTYDGVPHYEWMIQGSLLQDISGIVDDLATHEKDKKNPHAVTAAQSGALPITGGNLDQNAIIGFSGGFGFATLRKDGLYFDGIMGEGSARYGGGAIVLSGVSIKFPAVSAESTFATEEWVNDERQPKRKVVTDLTTTDVAFQPVPNTTYRFGSLSSLAVSSLGDFDDEYAIVFTAGAGVDFDNEPFDGH
ncbi:MAG: hypothetical protein FWF84_07305, partial [Kiritimatiellaeota bacterium]|nr:hypothetical protein [Kiritimatiellota bacterium]